MKNGIREQKHCSQQVRYGVSLSVYLYISRYTVVHLCAKGYWLAIRNKIVTCGKMHGMGGHCMEQEKADLERQVLKSCSIVGQESGFGNACYIYVTKY